MREGVLQSKIRGVLCKKGSPVRVWRNNVGRRKDADTGEWFSYGLGVGSADLIGIIVGTGRFLGIEVKTATGRQSPEQKAWQKTITEYGGVALVLRSVEEAEAFLQRITPDGSYQPSV